MDVSIITAIKKLNEERTTLITALTEERARLAIMMGLVDGLLKELKKPADNSSKDESDKIRVNGSNGHYVADIKSQFRGQTFRGIKAKIIAYLRTHPNSSATDIVKGTGEKYAHQWLTVAMKNKIVKRTGRRGHFRYRLAK